jgi:hypothetical protein
MSSELACSLLAALLAQHRYGQSIGRDELLRIASFPSHRGGDAKDAFERLRREPFIRDRGQRGIMLDSSSFGQLAQHLYDECGWSEFRLRVRLKHFEGWSDLDFD